MSWRALAECRGLDPALFHPEQGELHTLREAQEVCSTCRVQTECLLDGLREPVGVWGGLHRNQRRQLARLLGVVRSSGAQPKAVGNHGVERRYRAGCRCHECRACHAEKAYQYNLARRARLKAAG